MFGWLVDGKMEHAQESNQDFMGKREKKKNSGKINFRHAKFPDFFLVKKSLLINSFIYQTSIYRLYRHSTTTHFLSLVPGPVFLYLFCENKKKRKLLNVNAHPNIQNSEINSIELKLKPQNTELMIIMIIIFSLF